MNDNVDIRAGYRVPDGYFEDFSARMAAMASQRTQVRSTGIRFMRRTWIAVSSAAAAVVLALGLFFASGTDAESRLASVPADVLVTRYFGATESEVIDYYYLPASETDDSQTISDEDILNYLSGSGNINLYSLLEN